jgi:hypothetical protein
MGGREGKEGKERGECNRKAMAGIFKHGDAHGEAIGGGDGRSYLLQP